MGRSNLNFFLRLKFMNNENHSFIYLLLHLIHIAQRDFWTQFLSYIQIIMNKVEKLFCFRCVLNFKIVFKGSPATAHQSRAGKNSAGNQKRSRYSWHGEETAQKNWWRSWRKRWWNPANFGQKTENGSPNLHIHNNEIFKILI